MTANHAIRSYGLLLRFNYLRMRNALPIFVVAQIVIAAGNAVGLALILPTVDPTTGYYLATGGATISCITLGLVLLPQSIAQLKAQGFLDLTATFPVPKAAFLASELTIWLMTLAPGTTLALILASLRFNFPLRPSPLAVPAFLLIALTASALGYALATLSPNPMLTSLATNVVLFGSLLFSPINYPVERLPDWLAAAHRFLPLMHMADLVRATLQSGTGPVLGPFLVLGAWAIVATAGSLTAMAWRR